MKRGLHWLIVVMIPWFAAADPVVVAGGVCGASDIAVAENSVEFRAAGGGLYLHNNGWQRLDDAERKMTLELFKDCPLGIELGFRPSGKAWGGIYRDEYVSFDMKPLFIAANAFAGNSRPTPQQWEEYSAELRKSGVPGPTLILPTFEYANFASHIPALSENKVSDRADFQQIITVAGGIVLDTPCGYFFSREQNYRDWVIDSIQWCRQRGHKVVIIASPHVSKDKFPQHTEKYIEYLSERNCLPDIWVCENYEGNADPKAYANRVGAEDNPVHILGTALKIMSGF